jgi:hypothetical protein
MTIDRDVAAPTLTLEVCYMHEGKITLAVPFFGAEFSGLRRSTETTSWSLPVNNMPV